VVQGKLFAFFFNRLRETDLFPVPQWRFQVKPTRFRIPDLVVTREKPNERILTKAPLLCVEILSPEDTVSRVNERVKEYLAFGVPVVWVIDPGERRIWIYRASGIEEALDPIKLDGAEIAIPFSEIFD
jgi:Uma2 family endonuclease